MVVDTLVGINGELVRYGEMISQIARAKSYYVPAEKAKPEEVEHVRCILSQPTM